MQTNKELRYILVALAIALGFMTITIYFTLK